ncbi:amidohydrolase [Daejeonella sp.]|jgi:predicted amidohydrolase YtcJ|uniref:amidohydrolase n=1 Tax=Daejeonella sp. TaxID=2805397 RepID=UPI0037C00D42
MARNILWLIISVFLFSCKSQKEADLIVHNALVYTVDEQFSTVEAFAVKGGKILELGTSEDILKKYQGEKIDAEGKTIFPGFIDGHAHFYGYGKGLQDADLVGTKSWEEILEKLKTFSVENKEGWIIGRGWDQNDWALKEFPNNQKLNDLFPNRPVILTRVDGHAAIANSFALNLARLKPGQQIVGGEIETINGKLTGILVDNAEGLVFSKVPPPSAKQLSESLLDAQKNCFAVGLTTVADCGISHELIPVITDLQKSDQLKMRIYAMLSDQEANYDYLFRTGAIKTDRLNVRSFKVYMDGALGSRGASLLQPYSDKPSTSGFLLSDKKHFEEVAIKIAAKGFQMNTHAIGDSANREILQVYERVLKGKNDARWRIEHAQVVNKADFKLFGNNNVIPSVQSTHATSDMYWAADRLGPERVIGAYAFKQLLDQNGWLILGTDFPVEDINPMLTFYAAVVRKDTKSYPEKGYQIENALSREEAIRGMTIWAAKGNFEEKEKGSLEAGKFADFVILDQDLMKADAASLFKAKVLKTYLNGENVYSK